MKKYVKIAIIQIYWGQLMNNTINTTKTIKHTARFFINQIDENPEKFGVTKEHIKQVKKIIKRTDEQIEQNPQLSNRIKPGVIIKVNGKLAKITEHTDIDIVAVTSKGIVLKAILDDVIICRNQDKAHDRYTVECNKNTEKQLKKADKEYKQVNKKENVKKNKKETKNEFIDISGW